ncbi:unnamed protein product [Mytilus edulis]|uniref:C-type lectin domain-containing protein n=1 Tax=Mytilus edulis TaxID=6550 RepID=A0A8S3VH79_MYTED|nr:unnamed protein product [Mytilus edulis]
MVDNGSKYVQSGTYMNQIANRTENDEHEHEHFTQSSQSLNVNIMNDKERKTEEDTKVLHTSHKTNSTVLLKTAVAPVWSDLRLKKQKSYVHRDGKSIKNIIYQFNTKQNNWDEAEIECMKQEGYLLKIEDVNEFRWIVARALAHSVDDMWIGLRKKQ